MDTLGFVASCWRYPVKSMQGHPVDRIDLAAGGVTGDRHHGLIDAGDGRLLSAKRIARLLDAVGHDERIDLPDGTSVALDDPEADAVLSAWLDRPVRLARPEAAGPVSYQMTFDPPHDEAELFDIPAPEGTFLDLADVHLVTTATLEACAAARPDLDWDVRRFRPNLVLDVAGERFVEQGWIGQRLRLGATAEVEVLMPTVRCAMPLRAQPGLERQPELFRALTELNPTSPNHLGVYARVVKPGPVCPADDVVIVG